MSTYAQRVAKGAALLDEKWPNWAQEVDIERLDIRDANNCMTAQYAQAKQIGGNYRRGAEDLDLHETFDENGAYTEHGFNALVTPHSYNDGSRSERGYAMLNRLWRELIISRRAEAAQERDRP